MYQKSISNKNFDVWTCGTLNFRQFLKYKKNDQNPLVNPAEILKKNFFRKFSKFRVFWKFSKKMIHNLKVNIIYQKVKDVRFF